MKLQGMKFRERRSQCVVGSRKIKIKINETIEILKDEVIKQSKVSIIIKTLGVLMNTRLKWSEEFEYVKNKMKVTINKLMRVEMKTHQIHTRLNVHVLTDEFLGMA